MDYWTSLRTTHRDIATSLGISAAVHLALLLTLGTALYTAGNDDMDVPELSVQLVTREGPSSEEFTDAALPQPVPDPVEDVLNDPGTGEQTVDAPAGCQCSAAAGSDTRRQRARVAVGLSLSIDRRGRPGRHHPRRVS